MRINPGIRKANRELMEEGYRQINLKIGGAGLALHRYWGYGTKRISTMMDELLRGWNECAADSSASMLTMLESETGIELAVPGEKSYHELIYLNGTPRADLTDMQTIAMRKKQTKWVGTTILASVMLSMHRLYGFGADRDTQLMNQIAEIEREFRGSGSRIVEELRKETGVEFRQKGET